MIYIRYYLILIFLISPACTNKLDSNYFFEEKFGKEVSKIKKYRKQPEYLSKKIHHFRSPTQKEIAQSFNKSKYNKYRYIDVSQFNEIEEDYFNNRIRANVLSPRIFDIIYYTKNHGAFIIEDDYFANIKIPAQDAYGNATQFNSKPYLLIGNKSLKDSMDYILKNNNNSDHIEQSKKLIYERSELKYNQKMKQLLGN